MHKPVGGNQHDTTNDKFLWSFHLLISIRQLCCLDGMRRLYRDEVRILLYGATAPLPPNSQIHRLLMKGGSSLKPWGLAIHLKSMRPLERCQTRGFSRLSTRQPMVDVNISYFIYGIVWNSAAGICCSVVVMCHVSSPVCVCEDIGWGRSRICFSAEDPN